MTTCGLLARNLNERHVPPPHEVAAAVPHVRDVGPERVLTHHGFATEFARIVSERGVEAAALPGREERPRDDV